MLGSIGKFASFLMIGGLTALAIFLQYFRNRSTTEPVDVNTEVIETSTFVLHVIHRILKHRLFACYWQFNSRKS